jgi:hypothetical protein
MSYVLTYPADAMAQPIPSKSLHLILHLFRPKKCRHEAGKKF